MRYACIFLLLSSKSILFQTNCAGKSRTISMIFTFVCNICKVYAVDWSPDGEKVASGGKDRVLKLWMN